MTKRSNRLSLVTVLLGASAWAPVPQADAATHTKHHTTRAHSSSASARTAAPAAQTPTTPGAAPVAAAPRRARSLNATQGSDDFVSSHQERIVVTGSMLTTSGNQSANPVQFVTSKQIQQTGATTIGDFMQRLPSVGSSGTYNTETNGTDGSSCLDLRNLGSNRVLVLIDGKRTTINGDNNCVDLNGLPTSMISSIEILKDGGSELYGADAVSGVVNIKLRHNLDTGNVMVRGGISGHGDARTGIISAYKGWNFDHDRGNLTLSGYYMSQGGVLQRDRSWATPAQANNPSSASGVNYGSSIPPNGQFFGVNNGGDYAGSSNGTLTDWSKSNRYNYGQAQQLLNQLQDSSLTGDFHYDFNRHFTLYANVLYSHRTSSAQMAAEPVTGAVPPSDMPAAVVLPENYPGNTTGDSLQVYKRLTELGVRRTESATDTVTGKVGASGEIVHNWMYDLSYTYGSNMSTTQVSGVGNYASLLNSWGLRATSPGDPNSGLAYDPSVCDPGAGCVASNAFLPMSQDAANYVNYTSHSHYQYQLRDLNLRLHNDNVVHMPYQHGGSLGIAMGMEHRGEQLSYAPDPLIASGQSLTNTSLPTSGGFNVTEGYIEGRLTLLQDAFLAKDLTIDGQGRYSSYNTFGDTKNWKASINWAPTRDIAFHATLGTSYRQPNVYELYGGQQIGYLPGNDPCGSEQAGLYGAQDAMVAANCAKAGINVKNFQDANAGQIPTLVGGNRNLKPEEGRTYTFGATLTPRWIPNFSTSVTFWHYTLKGLIGSLSPQYIADQCYTGEGPDYCKYITRYQQGSQIYTIQSFDSNLGNLHESGLDWDLDYHFRVTRRDSITISNNFQQLINYANQNAANGPWYHYTGALFPSGGGAVADGGLPRVRDYATVSWQHGPLTFNYMMQYIGGMRWNDGSDFLTPLGTRRYKTPGMFQNDVSINYRWKDWNFLGGIQNIADKRPPFVASATDNSLAAQYGSFYVGRYFFLQAGMNF